MIARAARKAGARTGSHEGLVAVVTGARLNGGGENIGSATARLLAHAGAAVLVVDHDEDGARRLAECIRAGGGQSEAFPADVTLEQDVESIMCFAQAQFGGVDVLVNNVGSAEASDHGVAGLDLDVWDRTFAVNARSVLLGCKHAIPLMLERGGGSIVNVASAQGLIGDISHPAYGAAKAAVVALTRYVATEYGKQGIRCNSVAPGLTLTATARRIVPEEIKAIHLRHTLSPRLAEPKDIANLIAFLSSDGAELINAEVMLVDGGMNAHRALTADMQEWEEASVR